MGIDTKADIEDAPRHPFSRMLRRFHFWMTWLSFALLSAAGWMRMVDSITDRYWLNLAGVAPGPGYLAITGALWGLAGLAAAVWLLVRPTSGRAAASIIALGVALSYWIDRLFIDQAPLAGSNAPFALLLTLLWLAAVAIALRSWNVFGR